MHLLTPVIPLLTWALAGASLGCSVVASPAEPAPSVVTVPAAPGQLTVRWTVAGSDHPAVCSAYAASDLELVVYDEAGSHYATATAPCDGFTLTLPLPEGTYSADATLIDARSNARSTTKPLHAIEIVGGTDLAIDLDFPSTSIL